MVGRQRQLLLGILCGGAFLHCRNQKDWRRIMRRTTSTSCGVSTALNINDCSRSIMACSSRCTSMQQQRLVGVLRGGNIRFHFGRWCLVGVRVQMNNRRFTIRVNRGIRRWRQRFTFRVGCTLDLKTTIIVMIMIRRPMRISIGAFTCNARILHLLHQNPLRCRMVRTVGRRRRCRTRRLCSRHCHRRTRSLSCCIIVMVGKLMLFR